MSLEFNHTAHKELWNWLAENPGMHKWHWPKWPGHQLVHTFYYGCFACEYADQFTLAKDRCRYCPLVWPGESGCLDAPHLQVRRGLFDLWDDLTDSIIFMSRKYGQKDAPQVAKRKKLVANIAAYIRDLPVKEGVPCR